MGNWKNFTGLKVDALDVAIAELMQEYGEVIFKAADDGIAAAAKELAALEKAASPKQSGTFSKKWRVNADKYKLIRFVGNSHTVFGKDKTPISLANIFEYSATKGKPFIKQTFNANVNKLAKIIMGKIEKEA
jgi:hypothetical protein